jgi:hypothetical protein
MSHVTVGPVGCTERALLTQASTQCRRRLVEFRCGRRLRLAIHGGLRQHRLLLPHRHPLGHLARMAFPHDHDQC